MTSAESITLLVFCVAAYVMLCDLFRERRIRRLRARFLSERNRNRFGELRTKMVRLAMNNELDARSKVFVSAYSAATTLMRNPHELERAAQAVLSLPPIDQERGTSRREIERPTRAEGDIAREFATRIDLMCRDYSKVYLVAAWILDRLSNSNQPPLWLSMAAARAQRSRVGPMVDARQRLERTARLAASCAGR